MSWGILMAGILYASVNIAQSPSIPLNLSCLGTRSWIRLLWQTHQNDHIEGYKLYWSLYNKKPDKPNAILTSNINRYYITSVDKGKKYYIWLEAFNAHSSSKAVTINATTQKDWVIDTSEVNHLSIPSSAAVPAGMKIFWNDEFNDELLNLNKWSTNYYSTINFFNSENLAALQNDTLPQPGIIMTGSSVKLVVNDSIPKTPYAKDRKISSIQTYDWNTDENHLDNRKGGYYEVRLRRSNTSQMTTGLNEAYWFDSPGPDLKYYMEKGQSYHGVAGVRPHGQAFEIDVFEEDDNAETSTYTPFTLHGNVAADGTFKGNLSTFNAPLINQDEWVTHGILWSPTGIKYYINGVLQKEWTDPHKNMSPNHAMNILLGNYYGWTPGMKNSATLEIDYIRGYQWPVINGNELPNSGFEYGSLPPWTGTASINVLAKRSGKAGLLLLPGQAISQYVFLDNKKDYQLKYWGKGNSRLKLQIENIAQVTGAIENIYKKTSFLSNSFSLHTFHFITNAEYKDNMRTVKITFTNIGKRSISLDDLKLYKYRRHDYE